MALAPRQQKLAYLGAYVGWLFDYFEISLLSLIIVPVAAYLGLSASLIALTLAIQLGTFPVGGIIWGWLGDKYGRKSMMMWTIVIYGFGALMRAFTFSYWWFILWTIIAALGIGGEYGLGNTLVAEAVGKERRGWWAGTLYGALYFGIMISALFGGYVIPVVGWRMAFVLAALPVFAVVLIRFTTPESELWKASVKERAEKHLSIRQTISLRKYIIFFVIALVPAVLESFAYYGIVAFLPTWLVKEGLTLTKASWWIFYTALGGLAGNTVGAVMNDRIGRRATGSILSLISGVSGFVLVAEWPVLLTSSLIIIPFFFVFFGLTVLTQVGPLCAELFPTSLRSTTTAAVVQIGRGMGFFPPLIAVALLPLFGYGTVVELSAVEALVIAGWMWFFPETRNMKLPETLAAKSSMSGGTQPLATRQSEAA